MALLKKAFTSLFWFQIRKWNYRALPFGHVRWLKSFKRRGTTLTLCPLLDFFALLLAPESLLKKNLTKKNLVICYLCYYGFRGRCITFGTKHISSKQVGLHQIRCTYFSSSFASGFCKELFFAITVKGWARKKISSS